jgi:hypothetical protein
MQCRVVHNSDGDGEVLKLEEIFTMRLMNGAEVFQDKAEVVARGDGREERLGEGRGAKHVVDKGLAGNRCKAACGKRLTWRKERSGHLGSGSRVVGKLSCERVLEWFELLGGGLVKREEKDLAGGFVSEEMTLGEGGIFFGGVAGEEVRPAPEVEPGAEGSEFCRIGLGEERLFELLFRWSESHRSDAVGIRWGGGLAHVERGEVVREECRQQQSTEQGGCKSVGR